MIFIVFSIVGLLFLGTGIWAMRAQKKKTKEAAEAKTNSSTRHDDYMYRGDSRSASSSQLYGYLKLGGLGLGSAIILFAFIANTIVGLDPGNAKLVRSFTGEIQPTSLYLESGGWAFKSPLNSTIDYDIRNRVLKFEGDGTGVTGAEISSVDKNGARASFPVTIDYSIPQDKLAEIYGDYGDQSLFEAKAVIVKIRNYAELTPRNYETAVFRNQQAAAQSDLKAALQNDPDLMRYSITINVATIGTPKYPDNIESSLGQIQEARNLADKALADLQTARVAAEKTRVEAGAQSDYDQIVRCGASYTPDTQVINGQEVTVTKVTPKSGADCENLLNEQVLATKYIEALKEMAEKGNLIVVPEGFNGILNMPARQE